MEIYKLTDDTLEKALTITDLKQGVKNPNRVNVFVNGKYSFSLDVTQVVDFKLKVGLKISEDQLTEYKKASEFGKLYQRTLEWVLIRPRSVRELRDYLWRKKTDYGEIIMKRLLAKGYVDDKKFAEYYVENRFVKKGISQKRLKMELLKKGVDAEIIEEVLEKRDDVEEIDKMIARKHDKYDEEKLISYLCRQGFPYQLAQNRVREYGKD